ncbi:MAG: recombinase family protein [Myxococcales bacterium]|nr:recombinase family protein [Myxococcales bacterium]MDH5307830.1 recombinase family protein [Myxococcales bacterium]MDH5566555.1 recombinase family protein [Myxococcales bacterium]
MKQRAVAYYRIPHPRDPGGALPAQVRAVTAFARARSWVLIEPFVERPAHSGDRSELRRALRCCEEFGALLLVPELAPLARDCHFLDAVLGARVRLAAMDEPRIGRRSLALLRDVAARARTDASARSRAALASARRRGVRLGSPHPELGARLGAASLRARADLRAHELAPCLAEIRLSNPDASLRAIATVLEALDIPTARGRTWGPSAVRNVLQRLEGPARSTRRAVRREGRSAV